MQDAGHRRSVVAVNLLAPLVQFLRFKAQRRGGTGIETGDADFDPSTTALLEAAGLA